MNWMTSAKKRIARRRKARSEQWMPRPLWTAPNPHSAARWGDEPLAVNPSAVRSSRIGERPRERLQCSPVFTPPNLSSPRSVSSIEGDPDARVRVPKTAPAQSQTTAATAKPSSLIGQLSEERRQSEPEKWFCHADLELPAPTVDCGFSRPPDETKQAEAELEAGEPEDLEPEIDEDDDDEELDIRQLCAAPSTQPPKLSLQNPRRTAIVSATSPLDYKPSADRGWGEGLVCFDTNLSRLDQICYPSKRMRS